jgi:hypothetical protein
MLEHAFPIYSDACRTLYCVYTLNPWKHGGGLVYNSKGLYLECLLTRFYLLRVTMSVLPSIEEIRKEIKHSGLENFNTKSIRKSRP